MPTDPHSLSHIVNTAARLLTESWGGEVRLGAAETLREEKCYRFAVVTAPIGAPPSVIVKTALAEPGLPIDPDSTEGNPAQPLLEEWAGLAFLNERLPETSLVPRFYGGDRTACLIAFEDLGAGASLVDALQGSNPELARERLIRHAEAVARLHAGTLGPVAEARYREIRDALGPREAPRDWKRYGHLLATQGWGDLSALEAELREGFAHIGQESSAAFWDEYASLAVAMEDPSPFRAYVHNDSCPDNTVFGFSSSRASLIDFERGGYHACLLDAAYCRLSMPHCYWVGRLPDDVAPAAERAYRLVLGRELPEIEDDRRFGRAMTEACAYWIVSSGMWGVHRGFDRDFEWGPATWRQRVLLRLERFAATTEEFSWLPAMGAAARETVHRLRSHWTVETMTLFPAFQ